MEGYYRWIIADLSSIAVPSTDLTEKGDTNGVPLIMDHQVVRENNTTITSTKISNEKTNACV